MSSSLVFKLTIAFHILMPTVLLFVKFSPIRRHTPIKYNYQTLYFEQPIDHFAFNNNYTFKERYLTNEDYWKHGGPIFFYTGNEGDITWFCNNTGFMWDLAPEFNAMLIFAEHRYYGESLPYGNNSYKDLEHVGYLSSEQAMADYARLIQYIKSSPATKSSPVITLGGSYGGMLAAWIRMKYPHLFIGSLASSAPIWEFYGINPCENFNQIITKDFEDVSPVCSNTIRKSWKYINVLGESVAGKKWLQKTFRLCDPIVSKSDIDTFKSWLYNVWFNLAEINYPYPTSFLQPVPGWPIKAVCKFLWNDTVSDKQLLQQIVNAANLFYNYTGQVSQCFNVSHVYNDPYIDIGWGFQSCTEMVMGNCADGVNDMFEPYQFDFKLYSDECWNQWKVRPDNSRGERMFGGKNIKAASNIIFTNGGFDPWMSYGVTKNISDSLISIFIPDGAHHLDLRSANKLDPPSVIKAREDIKQYFWKWINEHQKKNRKKKTSLQSISN